MSSNPANRIQAFLGRAKLICSNSEMQERVSPQQSSISPKLRDRTTQGPSVSLSRVLNSKPKGTDNKSPGKYTGGNSPSNGKLSPSSLSPKNHVSPLRYNITVLKDSRLSPKPKSLSDRGLSMSALSSMNSSLKPQTKDSISEMESIVESLSKNSVELHQKVQNGLKTDIPALDSLLSLLEKEKSKAANSDRSVELDFKRKSEKLLEAIKEEALVMDRKLSEAQVENKKLQDELHKKEDVRRKIVQKKRSEMKSCASYINLYSKQDSKQPNMQSLIRTLNNIDINSISDIEQLVPKVFQGMETSLNPYELTNLINSLCTRLMEEQTERLILEEKTYQIISEKEFRVRELEARVKDQETRSHSRSMDKIMSPKHLLQPYEPHARHESMNKIVNGVLEQVYDFAINT